ncbi:hypothetical protein I6N95_19150 [Vagococcus sp. BWB3-3]|uniref:Uncharacterized protein n=1 Tax=Vagococcus allomyrinae TaxID=2794353 RepID=A0A940SWL8_9ENTE|nr:hypothetical protein [Vagococcus allomyrinae]MBP1043139.1 hypothetical protein [Vagococcus allomyrinae]
MKKAKQKVESRSEVALINNESKLANWRIGDGVTHLVVCQFNRWNLLV